MSEKVGRAIGHILAIILFISILVGIGYAVWVGVPWFYREIAGLYGKAETEFKLGLITAVVSTAGVAWSVIYQRRKELDALRFERKREAYAVFFDLLFEFMKASDNGIDPLEDPTFKDRWRGLTKGLMIWGNPRTITAFNKFQSGSSQTSNDFRETVLRVESLLRQFRADLGHRDAFLKRFALTKLILRGDEHHKLDG